MQIYADEDGELSDRLLGFIGDGESANRRALRDLEGQYYFLVNLWCQAHCISLFLKVSIPIAAYILTTVNGSFLAMNSNHIYPLLERLNGSVILQDLVNAWPRFQAAVDAAHTIVKALHAHADIRQRLKW